MGNPGDGAGVGEGWDALGCKGYKAGTSGNQEPRSPVIMGVLQGLRQVDSYAIWKGDWDEVSTGLAATGRSCLSLSVSSPEQRICHPDLWPRSHLI